MKVLIGCTGSVATIKVNELVDQLKESNFEVQLVVTKCAKHFLSKQIINCKVWVDEDEWNMWNARGDPVLHIDLRKWADILVIAPLDANSLAKIANGICDNLLTCTVRAWDLEKPLYFCPAMNTYMWNHPITAEHILKLKTFGYIEIPCISKTLVCGDSGLGAMTEVKTIVEKFYRSHYSKILSLVQTRLGDVGFIGSTTVYILEQEGRNLNEALTAYDKDSPLNLSKSALA